MANNFVKLHRVFTASPEKVFKAFTDADAMASWLPPYGFIGKVHSMDFKVGGTYKMSFINFTTGSRHSFGGNYLELYLMNLLNIPTNLTTPICPDK